MTNIKVIEKIGKNPGKKILILAGVHGDEVCGIKAFNSLIQKLNIISGKVIFIYANLEAIKQDKRCIEYNLNRCFLKEQPPEIKDTLEGKTAKEIIPYLEWADIMLDLHASFTDGSSPFVICDEKQTSNASIFNSDTVTYNWDKFEPGSTDYFMNLQNKPGFCFECGYSKSKKSQEIAEKAIINFLVFTENIDGKLNRTSNQRYIKINGIYKNKSDYFKKARYFKDFEKLKERALIGIDGDEKIYANKDTILLFVTDTSKSGEECFLTAEETLLNNRNLNKLKECFRAEQ